MRPNYILIDSKDRVSGTSHNFSVNFPIALTGLKAIKLLSANIPSGFYNINSSNNNLYISDGTLRTITLSPGNYSSTTIVSALTTALNSSGSPFVFTVTYSQITMKLNISATGAFTILSGINPIADILGFNVPTASNTIQIASTILELNTVPYLFIEMSNVTNNIRCANNLDYAAFVIPVTVNGGSINNFTQNSYFTQAEITTNNISSFDIRIKTRGNLVVDLNGAELNLIFQCLY